MISSVKSANCCISLGVMVPSLPTRPSNATMKLRNEKSSEQGAPRGYVAQGQCQRSRRPGRRASASRRASPCRAGSAWSWALSSGGRWSRAPGRGLAVGCVLVVTMIVRVAQVPGQLVHVAEDVAARTGRLAVARGRDGVVQEGAPCHDLGAAPGCAARGSATAVFVFRSMTSTWLSNRVRT